MDRTPVIFLDRDGVINKKPDVHCYVSKPDEMVILPGVSRAIRKCNEAGWPVVVVSNQRGIARNILTLSMVNEVNDYLNRELAKDGAHIDSFYICPHDIGVCQCRKPKPGMLIEAENDLRKMGIEIDKEHSYMIGDAGTDILAGLTYGVHTILVGNGVFDEADIEITPEYSCENLDLAVDLIYKLER